MSDNDLFSKKSKVYRTPPRSNNNNNNNGLTDLLNVSNNLSTLNNRTNDSGLENTNQHSDFFEGSTSSAQQGENHLINLSTENLLPAGNRSFISVLPIDLDDSLASAFAGINIQNFEVSQQLQHTQSNESTVTPTENDFQSNIIQVTEMALSLSDILSGIPEFSSKSQGDINRFVENADMMYDLCAEAQKPNCLRIIKTRLVNAQKLGSLTDKTWPEIKVKINEKYRIAMPFETAQERLLTINQTDKETLEAYANRVKTLLDALNAATLDGSDETKAACRKMNENLAIRKFKQNIFDEKIRLMALSSDHTTLFDAIAHATQKQEQLESSNVIKEKIQPKIPEKNDRQKQKKKENGKQSPKCEYCNKRGHSADQCYQKNKQEAQQSEANSEKNAGQKASFYPKNKNIMSASTNGYEDQADTSASDDSDCETAQAHSFKLLPLEKPLN